MNVDADCRAKSLLCRAQTDGGKCEENILECALGVSAGSGIECEQDVCYFILFSMSVMYT